MNTLAFLGAGRLAASLATALHRQGQSITAVASRNHASAVNLAARLAGTQALDIQAAVDAADLVFITVPDDAIATIANTLRWRPGQRVVHCSGATEVAALNAAAQAGALTGGFHPLQIFSDPDKAIELLAGSSVAIEAPEPLAGELHALATALGMRALTLPAGARARYHASANFAASFLLPVLAEAVSIWERFGIDESAALAALLPLAHGTLVSAGNKGLVGAGSGPISRGDAGVIAKHLTALGELGTEHVTFYRELGIRQLQLAEKGHRLNQDQLKQLRELLELWPAR
jgi:predicted short-subunit dehydrogenase-like oxidoreductase (DUF2520 family)